MNIKCNVNVDAWLGQIVDTGCEVGIVLVSPSVQCQIKSAYRGDEGGVTNEDIIGVSMTGVFIQSSQYAFQHLP